MAGIVEPKKTPDLGDDLRIAALESEVRYRTKFIGEICWMLDLTTHASCEDIMKRLTALTDRVRSLEDFAAIHMCGNHKCDWCEVDGMCTWIRLPAECPSHVKIEKEWE